MRSSPKVVCDCVRAVYWLPNATARLPGGRRERSEGVWRTRPGLASILKQAGLRRPGQE